MTTAERILFAARKLRGGQGELAQRIGVHRNTVTNWVKGRSAPDTSQVSDISKLTQTPMEWLINGTGSPDLAPDQAFEAAFARGLNRISAGFEHLAEPDQAYTAANIITVRATSPAPTGGFIIGGGNGHLRRPHGLLGIDAAYAIRMPDSSMAERHRQGDPLFIHPHRPATAGDSVLVLTRASSTAPVTAWLREFVSHSDASTIVRQLRPDAITEFPGTTIIAIHKVLSPDDLFAL
jgi:phage repressor protein C with HTH and peptisase S24 domain